MDGNGTVLAESVSVADTSDRAVDEVASPVFDILPDLISGTETEVLVNARLTHDGHAPSLAIDGESTEDVEIDGEVARGVDVTTLRDDTHSVGELTRRAEDGGSIEPLVETGLELGDCHKSPLELSGLSVLGVVGQDLEESVDGGITREVVLVGDVLTFFRIRREDLGTPRTVEESTSDVLESEESGDDGDTELDRSRSLGISRPVTLFAREDELRTTDGSSHVVVVSEASALERTEHGTPDVLTCDGLPIVEVDDTVDVPLCGGVIIGPGVLPGSTVRTSHGISHGVLGADHAVEVGTSTSGRGLGVGLSVLGVEVSGVGGIGDGLEGRTSDLLGTVQEVFLVGADVGDTTGITLVDFTGTSCALVQNVLFVDVGDLVEAPKRESDLPDSSIVQVETEAGEGTFLDTNHGVKRSVVTILVEGTNGEVSLRGPVDLTVGEDVVVRARDTITRFEDVEEPKNVVRVGFAVVSHVRVLSCGGSSGVAIDVKVTNIVVTSTTATKVLLGLSFVLVLEAFVFEVGEVTHVGSIGVGKNLTNVIRNSNSLQSSSCDESDESENKS
jgi:hypothetical protein